MCRASAPRSKGSIACSAFCRSGGPKKPRRRCRSKKSNSSSPIARQRRRRDFAASDKIRDELLARGIILEDSAAGTRWKRK
jgi:cysteinyl-tRNA synthetase